MYDSTLAIALHIAPQAYPMPSLPPKDEPIYADWEPSQKVRAAWDLDTTPETR